METRSKGWGGCFGSPSVEKEYKGIVVDEGFRRLGFYVIYRQENRKSGGRTGTTLDELPCTEQNESWFRGSRVVCHGSVHESFIDDLLLYFFLLTYFQSEKTDSSSVPDNISES